MIQALKLKKLGIKNDLDLINHLPFRYDDLSNLSNTKDAQIDETVTIKGEIVSIINQRTKRGLMMQIASVKDQYGKIQAIWFNQPFLTKIFYPKKLISVSGKVSFFGKSKALMSPQYEMLKEIDGNTSHTGKIVPIYPETEGVTSKFLRFKIRKAVEKIDEVVEEYLPESTLKKYDLIEIKKAYKNIHFPKSLDEALIAKKRLAFNELLQISLASVMKKNIWLKNVSLKTMEIDKKKLNSFLNSLPFKLTASQNKVVNEILEDLKKPYPMNRLLEGDVGSGKTVVAATAMYISYTNGFKSVLMAPTQILASQHFKTLKNLFPKLKVELVTTNTKKIKTADIYVGTHALIHQKINFDKVGVVVIDEQHRFGVEQRQHLVNLSKKPHLLTMTATPIPRTIAQTLYGDLDLSVIDEMPKGRQIITTWTVPKVKWNKGYEWVRNEIQKNKSQAFVVCPLIEESTHETMKDIKNVTTHFEELKTRLKGVKLGLLHGRLKKDEKDKILEDFKNKKIDILVATPVVEVGIDIPNATIMVIETPEKFGLAQLHQLRGRVGRGNKKSYCLLMATKETRRLKALSTTHSGFELAELDLKLRGPGELLGIKQSGFFKLKAASWTDSQLIAQTKELANQINENSKMFPQLIKSLDLGKI